jgi:hypothetical protein
MLTELEQRGGNCYPLGSAENAALLEEEANLIDICSQDFYPVEGFIL